MLLCLVLMLSVLPTASVAVEEEGFSEDQAIRQEVRRIYRKCLATSGKTSFHGFCGLMTSLQLYHLGITDGSDGSFNGKDQFDYYSSMPITTGGYRAASYSAKEYTLEEAINAISSNGTRNVSNILVGFEATNTEAGSMYGHALVIHRIVNGTVYYVENYATSMAGPEGNVIACSINTFANYYAGWTTFDGAVHFGSRDYSDSCQDYGTDLYVRTRFASTLRSEPCLLTENNCLRLRTLAAGELLHATAVYMNTRGEWYYRVDDGACTGYVAANAVSVVQVSPDALTLRDTKEPDTVVTGETLKLSGTVSAENCAVSNLRMTVTDDAGQVLRDVSLDAAGTACDLRDMNKSADLSALKNGRYILTVYGTATCVAVRGAGLELRHWEIPVHTQEFFVGPVPRTVDMWAMPAEGAPEGWFIRDGKWHCYRQGAPVTGWETYLGVSYYLDESGAVTTGWAEVDGQMRYFSATGALCYEWVTTDQGTFYWYRNGNLARGWQKLQGKLYCFDENGILQTDCTLEKDGIPYTADASGVATEK